MARAADRRGARPGRAAGPRAHRVGGYSHGMSSGSGSRRPSCAPPVCCCSTSRRLALTRQDRDMRRLVRRLASEGITSSSPAICSTKSRSSATAWRSCARAGRLRRIARRAQGPRRRGFRLRAVDPEGPDLSRCQHRTSRCRDCRRRASLQRFRGSGRGSHGRARPGAVSASPRSAPTSASLEELFLGPHRGTPTRRSSRRRSPDARGLPLGATQARAQKRTYLGLGGASSSRSPSSSRSRCSTGRADGRTARPRASRHRASRPLRRALLHVYLGLPLVTALVAGDIVASEVTTARSRRS